MINAPKTRNQNVVVGVLLTLLVIAVLLLILKGVLAWTNPIQAPPGGSGTGVIPAGTISSYGGSSAPSGWLLCNGSSVSTGTYPNLFDAIGYSYGGSGGSFNLPDMRGRVPVSLASGGKAEVNALRDNEGLTATIRNISHRHTEERGSVQFWAAGTFNQYGVNSNETVSTSGDGDNLNKPAYLVVNCIIKT